MCVCVTVVGLPWQNITSANKSNHIASSQKALQGPSRHIALFLPTGTEQDKTAELNSLTASCRLLDSIKTSQIHAHSCSV